MDRSSSFSSFDDFEDDDRFEEGDFLVSDSHIVPEDEFGEATQEEIDNFMNESILESKKYILEVINYINETINSGILLENDVFLYKNYLDFAIQCSQDYDFYLQNIQQFRNMCTKMGIMYQV